MTAPDSDDTATAGGGMSLRRRAASLRRAGALTARILRGVAQPDRISTAIFFLTHDCNARCPFCFDDQVTHLRGEKKTGKPLSVHEYERIAHHLPGLYQVMFGGGEPFLRKEIADIATLFYSRSGVRLFSISTNGYLRERVVDRVEEMAARCPLATFNIQVSLDAAGERHDELRGLKNGFTTGVALLRDLAAVNRRTGNVNTVISTAVTEHNVSAVGELIDYVRRELPEAVRFHNVQYDQRLGGFLSQPESASRVRAIDRKIAARPYEGVFDRLVQRYYIGLVNDLIVGQVRAGRMIYRCNAGRKLCAVMPDGRVAPCEPFLFEEAYAHFPHFNLRDHDLDYYALAADPKYGELLRFIAGDNCQACPWSCAAIASLTFSPRNWPLFARA